MAKDIEDFLRRAAERRKQQKPNRPAPSQPRPAQSAPQAPSPRVPLAPAEPVIIIDDVQVVEPKKKKGLRQQSVREHVESHLDTSDISQHADALGQRIAGVHSAVENRVHQNLDHDISKVDDRPTITNRAESNIVGAHSDKNAVVLRNLLANPKSLKQAILVSEVLKRPDFD